MLTGPAPASIKALERAGMDKGDIQLFELNEAFAAVVLRYMQQLDIDHDAINVNGGATAFWDAALFRLIERRSAHAVFWAFSGRFAEIVADRNSFVVKPAQGSGGDGIVVVTSRNERKRNAFRLAGGVLVSEAEVAHRVVAGRDARPLRGFRGAPRYRRRRRNCRNGG